MKKFLPSLLLPLACIGIVATSPAAADSHLEKWNAEARKEFASKQRYPRSAIESGIEGTVTVLVRVNAKGSITGYDIKESSNHEVLDGQVLSLLNRVDPLPALPAGSETHSFSIPLTYKVTGDTAVGAKVDLGKGHETLADWAKAVSRKVAHKQDYPAYLINKGVEGVTRVNITVASNGVITAQEIVQSSGHEVLDRETLELVGRISPLPALPENRKEFTFTLPVSYKVSK